MSVDLEFSKYAHSYEKYNIIQNQVADELLSLVKYKAENILDLGCGRGALAKKIEWEIQHFLGVDFAKNMLELHPKSEHIECIYSDFDNPALYEELFMYDFDYILSASALQWSQNLSQLFSQIARLNFQDFAFALFSANTFKTLHETAQIISPLPSTKQIQDAAALLGAQSYVKTYTLEFENTHEMFRYIKKSGVSGGRNLLSYKQTKKLMQDYPLNYLEFEVVFLHS